jgi:hypothetical protein
MFASVVVPMESARAAATIIVNNVDAPGVGFNDPTPAAPIAGNAGTTLGQQRLIAFSYAASIWGANVTSSVPIVIEASWVPLSCTAVAATLGSASATEVFSDFNGAPRPSTWYPFALANKLSGVNLDPGVPQIRARFNINLGGANCLAGSGWYYGLDGDEGTNVDFVATLMHELAHGLGFQTYTSASTGAFLFDVPSIWDHYLVDASTGKRWTEATAAERVASAISVDKLVWSGPIVTAAVPSTLRTSRPGVGISGPASGPLNGTTLLAGAASFGPALTTAGVTADVMPVAPTSSAAACTSLTALDALAVRGRIALIDRGTCTFAIKVKNAQIAGAIGVLIADNVAGSPPPASRRQMVMHSRSSCGHVRAPHPAWWRVSACSARRQPVSMHWGEH